MLGEKEVVEEEEEEEEEEWLWRDVEERGSVELLVAGEGPAPTPPPPLLLPPLLLSCWGAAEAAPPGVADGVLVSHDVHITLEHGSVFFPTPQGLFFLPPLTALPESWLGVANRRMEGAPARAPHPGSTPRGFLKFS